LVTYWPTRTGNYNNEDHPKNSCFSALWYVACVPTAKKPRKLPPRGTQGRFVNRKKTLRESPDWLDSIELGESPPPDLEESPPPGGRRVIPKNKADDWEERLPDPAHLAIMARRRELDARTYTPPVEPSVPKYTNLGPPRRKAINPRGEAVRNAALFALGALGVGFAISRIPHKNRGTNR
jgi:hypothetical protein